MQANEFYKAIQDHRPGPMEPGRQSAVAILFLTVNDQWHVLVEERAHQLRVQPGELCLPGGGVEPGESPVQAALRECCEELLVEPKQLQLWGQGDILTTPSGLTVHTVLARLYEYKATFSPQEVHTVFSVPVDWLLSQQPYRFDSQVSTCPGADFPQDWVPGGKNYPWRKGCWPIYFYPEYQGKRIWGITAKILYHTMERIKVLGGLPPAKE